MEKEARDAGAGATTSSATDVPINETAPSVQAKKPDSSPGFFQSAVLVIRRYASCRKPGFDAGPNSPIVQDNDDSGSGAGAGASMLSIVDGMRPLHLQPDYWSRPLQPPPPPAGFESFHDVSLPPPSPDNMSRYSSAQNLQAFDDASQDGRASDGNNSVDLMAEEFIAKFYEEMRLQRQESMSRHGDDPIATAE